MSGKGNLTPWKVVGNQPAFPCVIEQHNKITQESNIMQFGGMSQRQTIAMYALQGLLSWNNSSSVDDHIGAAFKYADAFLKFEFEEAMAELPPDAPDPNKVPSLIVVPK